MVYHDNDDVAIVSCVNVYHDNNEMAIVSQHKLCPLFFFLCNNITLHNCIKMLTWQIRTVILQDFFTLVKRSYLLLFEQGRDWRSWFTPRPSRVFPCPPYGPSSSFWCSSPSALIARYVNKHFPNGEFNYELHIRYENVRLNEMYAYVFSYWISI